MIEGCEIKPLKVLCDERGRLMEILRADEPIFRKFGQVYMTTAYPGVVKAWHYHKKQTDHFVCVKGMMKLVLYDARPESKTHKQLSEFFLGEHNMQMVSIPPVVYHGFKCIGPNEALVINIPTEVYNYASPDEFRLPPHTPEIPYDWARKDG